MQGQR